MATKKPTVPVEPTEEIEEEETGGGEKYVTKSELMETLREFFGGEEKETDEVEETVETDDDALGVYSVREIEKMIEDKVSKISKSLAAKKPAKDKDEKPAPKVVEEKPVIESAEKTSDRIKRALWGA